MPPRDPADFVEPDFEGDDWESVREALVAGGKTVEEAIQVMRQSWKAQYDRNLEQWEEQATGVLMEIVLFLRSFCTKG